MMQRLFGLAKNIIRSNFNCPGFPYRITLILTYKCNLRCQMCNIWKRNSYSELDLVEIERFFQKSNYFNWINISGGEIFLRQDLLGIVKAFVYRCNRLYLLDFSTNGFLTERIVNSTEQILNIKNIPPRVIITVSLDGPEDLHDKIRGAKGSWRKAVETFVRLKRIKDKRLRVFFGMTISSQNVTKIDDALTAVKCYVPEISHRDLHVNLLHHSEHYYQNDKSGMVDIEDLKKYVGTFIKRRGLSISPVMYLEMRYQSLARKFIETNKTPLPCKALSSSCFIDPGGDIYPCSIMNSKIGNIRDYKYDLAKLWMSAEAFNVRKLIKNRLCPQCWTPCEAYQTILGNLF